MENGTYIETREDAKRLGKLLVKIGKSLNKDVGYIISLMDEPVGKAVGNILEIKETIKALNGNMTKDVLDEIFFNSKEVKTILNYYDGICKQ